MTEREVIKKDNDFVYKIMKRDRRYRPTAKELLEDEWCMTALFSETGSAPAIFSSTSWTVPQALYVAVNYSIVLPSRLVLINEETPPHPTYQQYYSSPLPGVPATSVPNIPNTLSPVLLPPLSVVKLYSKFPPFVLV
jgi:hypothetical protein